jgi:hypothetical protein
MARLSASRHCGRAPKSPEARAMSLKWRIASSRPPASSSCAVQAATAPLICCRMSLGPLVHTLRSKDRIAYDDPRWMGGFGMIGIRAVYNAVQRCDLLLMVDTDYPYSNFLTDQGQRAPDRRAGARWGGAHRPNWALSAPRASPGTVARQASAQDRRKIAGREPPSTALTNREDAARAVLENHASAGQIGISPSD